MAASTKQVALDRHVARLRRCRRCPRRKSPPVSGGAIVSNVMIIGQAPGPREPTLKRPFAHTAGQTLFRWFEQFCAMNEAAVRSKIYFAAVCRCFPGKAPGGTDRVPAPDEIRNCAPWMNEEIEILQPRLIIPVGRLAITQFIDCEKLDKVIAREFRARRAEKVFGGKKKPNRKSKNGRESSEQSRKISPIVWNSRRSSISKSSVFIISLRSSSPKTARTMNTSRASARFKICSPKSAKHSRFWF